MSRVPWQHSNLEPGPNRASLLRLGFVWQEAVADKPETATSGGCCSSKIKPCDAPTEGCVRHQAMPNSPASTIVVLKNLPLFDNARLSKSELLEQLPELTVQRES